MNYRMLFGAALCLFAAACATQGSQTVVARRTLIETESVRVWREDIEGATIPGLVDEYRRHYYASNLSDGRMCVQVVFHRFVGGGYRHSQGWWLDPGAERILVAYGQAASNSTFEIDAEAFTWTPGAEGSPYDCSQRPASQR